MANVTVKQTHCINLRPNKHSYLTLRDPDGTFTASTVVVSVQDATNGFEWTPKVSKWKAGELRVRLKAVPHQVRSPKGGKDKEDTPPPDTGSLTITIRSPIKPVDPVTVDYVDDNEQP